MIYSEAIKNSDLADKITYVIASVKKDETNFLNFQPTFTIEKAGLVIKKGL